MPFKSAQEAIQKTNSLHFKQYLELEKERIRKQILEARTDYLTNPKFNTSLTRDSRGFIVSFEVPELFGKGKISSIMGDLAKGIKSFKKGMSDDNSGNDNSSKDSDNSNSENK